MKNFSLLSIIVLLIILGVSSAYAQPNDTETVIFFVDFEDGTIPNELSLSDIWQVTPQTIDDEARQVLSGQVTEDGGSELLMFSPPNGTTGNYSLETKIRFDDWPSFSLYVRLDDNFLCDGGYLFDYYGDSRTGSLGRIIGNDDCESEQLTESTEMFIIPQFWHILRVDVLDSKITFYLDNREVLSAEDDSYTLGDVGLHLFDSALVEIDYINLIALETNKVAATNETTQSQNTLENYNAQNWQDTITELESLELIPTEGGALLFRENYVFARDGNGYVPLAFGSQLQDVVISATVSVDISNRDVCSIMFRLIESERVFSYVELQADESLWLGDITKVLPDDIEFNAFDATAENHILIVAIGETVRVFLNGELTLESDEMPTRDGFFGLGLISENSSMCEVSPYWVYRYRSE